MKATLEFDLENDEESFSDAIHGESYKFALKDIVGHLRNKSKYGPPELSADQTYRDALDMIISHGITLDQIGL